MNYYAYVLCFDERTIATHRFVRQIDQIEIVANWYTPFPGIVLLISAYPAQALAESLRASTSLRNGSFVVADIDTDRWGWLPPPSWEFLQNRRPATGVQRGKPR